MRRVEWASPLVVSSASGFAPRSAMNFRASRICSARSGYPKKNSSTLPCGPSQTALSCSSQTETTYAHEVQE